MPIDALNRPSDQPNAFEVIKAAQEIPAERLIQPTQQDIDAQFEYMTQQPGLQELGVQTATTEAQQIAQTSESYDIPGWTRPTEAVGGYHIPEGLVETTVPPSPEVRRYEAQQAKEEALNAGDAVMRVRREALALAA